MNKFASRPVLMLMSLVFLATVVIVHLDGSKDGSDVYAQEFPIAAPPNTTLGAPTQSPLSELNMTNQTGESLVESLGSPISLMEDVRREVENTNATEFAARQLIEATRGNISSETSNMTETNMTGNTDSPNNITGDTTNDTAMQAVIEETVNTNATGFAADNVINMTSSTGP